MKISSIVLTVALIFSAALKAAPTDSTGRKVINGKTFVTHKVTSGETLSKLSKKYQVTVDEIKQANAGFTMLRAGETILIPRKYAMGASTNNAGTNQDANNGGRSSKHTVKAGETLFKIATQYGVKVEAIKTANSLTSDALRVGQVLIIPGKAADNAGPAKDSSSSNGANTGNQGEVVVDTGLPPDNKPIPDKPADKDKPSDKKEDTNPVEAQTGKVENVTTVVNENAATHIASVQEAKDQKLDQTRMFMLHPDAKIGTIVELYNPTNSRTAYARVVGNFSKGAYGSSDIVITGAVSEMLGGISDNTKLNISFAR